MSSRKGLYATQRVQKQTCRQWSDHFIYSKPVLSVLFFSIIERGVLMASVCYCKDMFRKVTTQRTQQFLAFLCYRKNPVKCSACAVARKIETDCFCRNLPISSDPVVRISRNLAKQFLVFSWRHKLMQIRYRHVGNLVPRVLSLPPSRKYPGCGWSCVYVYKSNPHRGWVFELIVS